MVNVSIYYDSFSFPVLGKVYSDHVTSLEPKRKTLTEQGIVSRFYLKKDLSCSASEGGINWNLTQQVDIANLCFSEFDLEGA